MVVSRSGMPPLTWLHAFDATARHLSFTRAAADLNLTQSAVSQHVRNLEAFLGRDLFVRKTRALELTEDGANYLPALRQAFDLIASSTQVLTGGDRGRHLTVQCNMAFSVFWLAPRLHRLYARHDWIVLNVVTPIWDPERLATHAAMEIRFSKAEDISPSAIRLVEDRFFPVCAPGYQEGKVDATCATLFDCAGMSSSWNAWYASQGLRFDRASEVNYTSTYVIAIYAVLAGAGLAMVHDTLVTDFLQDGRLVRPFPQDAPLTESYYLIPAAEHAHTPASKAFTDWLKDELGI